MRWRTYKPLWDHALEAEMRAGEARRPAPTRIPTMRNAKLGNAARQKQEREIIKQFLEAVRSGDRTRSAELLSRLDLINLGWCRVFRLLAKEKSVSQDMQAWWLSVWTNAGDHIRSEVNNDRVLIDGLRVLLLPYQGPALTLSRGDSAYNRKRRSYGLSWTSNRDTAETHATGIWQNFKGGSVLLETIAPPDAIICAVVLHMAKTNSSSTADASARSQYCSATRKSVPKNKGTPTGFPGDDRDQALTWARCRRSCSPA
jgi:hypothetical protein